MRYPLNGLGKSPFDAPRTPSARPGVLLTADGDDADDPMLPGPFDRPLEEGEGELETRFQGFQGPL